MTGGSSFFMRITVFDQIHIFISCKSVISFLEVSRDAYRTLHQITYGFETVRLNARNNRTRNIENMLLSFNQETIAECKIESFSRTG